MTEEKTSEAQLAVQEDAAWRLRAYKAVATIGGLVVAAVFVLICGFFWQAVAMLVLGGLLALMLSGPVEWIAKKTHNRGVSAVIVYALFLVVVAAVLLVFVPLAGEQMLSLVSSLPQYAAEIEQWAQQTFSSDSSEFYQQFGDVIQSCVSYFSSEQFFSQLSDMAQIMANGVIGAIDGISAVCIVVGMGFVLAFMISIDSPVIYRELCILAGSKHVDDFALLVDKAGTVVSGWLRAVLACALCNGIICGLACHLLGVPYAGLYAFINAVFYIIPGIGPIISCVICGVLALFTSWWQGIATALVCIVVPNVLAGTLSPYLMRDSVNIHPIFMFVGMSMGFALSGVVGALAAVPVIAIVVAVFTVLFERKTGEELSTPDGALFHKEQVKTPRKAKRRKEGD